MKYYTICYPDHNSLGEDYVHWETLSEKEILDYYYPHWCTMMIQNVAAPDLDEKRCIDDWCIVHWAERNYWRERMENAQ